MELDSSQSYSVKTLSHETKASPNKLEFKGRTLPSVNWGVIKVAGATLLPPQPHADMLLQAERTGSRLCKTRRKGLGLPTQQTPF